VQEPELNLVAPLNACPLPPRMQGNHPCTRYSSPHTRRLNRHRGSPVRLLMLQHPRQLRNVGGNASGLVAREQVRRRPPPNAADEAAKAEIIKQFPEPPHRHPWFMCGLTWLPTSIVFPLMSPPFGGSVRIWRRENLKDSVVSWLLFAAIVGVGIWGI
jgi:hypothetical protein